MGMNDFAPFTKKNGCFIVRNVTPDRQKTIKIFHYPILFNQTRDILQIPGVSESDIRASLLKGELKHKILAKDIIIECSDIDLLQFNEDQKTFLQDAGVINGLSVTAVPVLQFLFKQTIILNGNTNGINRIFTVPSPDKFINGSFMNNIFKIQVFHNGRELLETYDYIVSESGGIGAGFDTIVITSFAPKTNSKIFANYMIST